MVHYIYKITFETGHVYFGIRSCKKDPYEDNYFGSPVKHKDFWNQYKFTKTILKVYKENQHQQALDDERFLINWQWNSTKNGKDLSLNAAITYCSIYGQTRILTPGLIEGQRKRNEKQCIPFFLISPDCKFYSGKNLREFCDTNNIHYKTIWQVVSGKVKTWKGWCSNMCDWLFIKNYGLNYKYVEPIKVIHPIHGKDTVYGRRIFGRKWGISSGHVIDFCNDKKEACKGWTKVRKLTEKLMF